MAADELIVIQRKLKGDDGSKVISVRIKEETVKKLDNIAAQTGRSRNELIGMFLDYAIQRCKIEAQTE